MNTRRTGFTLVEILVVVVIIAVLAGVMIPVIANSLKTGKRATCLLNLHQIGMALIAYRQDNNVYPEPGKAIGALSSAYGKLLPKVPNCPRDPDKNHDTYDELYNYWGYAATLAPAPLQSIDDANTVYTGIQQKMTDTSTASAWSTPNNYLLGQVVSLNGLYFSCILAHSATIDNKPLVGPKWQDDWKLIVPNTIGSLWKLNKAYAVNDVVILGNASYICIRNHTSDNYVDANKDHVPDDTDNNPEILNPPPPRQANDPDVWFDDGTGLKHYTVVQSEPQTGEHWQKYWYFVETSSVWRISTGSPDAGFPGLANPDAPANTIVTICPQHVNDIHNLLVLRVSGDAGTAPQQKTDKEFWALSKMP